jgi:ketosteroid isomerase-like protein
MFPSRSHQIILRYQGIWKKKAIQCFLLFNIAGCNPNHSSEQDKEMVRQVVLDIISADNRSDIQTVLSLYDSSAILMPSGKDIIRGKAAIMKNYQDLFSSSKLQIVTEIEDISLEQSLAVVTGNNKGTVVSIADSVSKVMNSKYVMILQKKDSQRWLIQQLIWNDNAVR